MKFAITAMKTAVLAIAALGVLVPDVQACRKSPGEGGLSALRMFAPLPQSESLQSLPPRAESGSPENEHALDRSKIVGMWTVNFYVGDTTELWDFALEQFYADGNEMTTDISPPLV